MYNSGSDRILSEKSKKRYLGRKRKFFSYSVKKPLFKMSFRLCFSSALYVCFSHSGARTFSLSLKTVRKNDRIITAAEETEKNNAAEKMVDDAEKNTDRYCEK